MTPFLKQTALHYAGRPDAADLVFVLPNRRSVKFFEMYFKQAQAEACPGKPYLMQELCTVNEFFQKASGLRTADKVSLLVELYECYKVLDKRGETLDDFICWGDILLSDFDDVDKYLVNADGLYSNISDLKEMEDDCSYMTEGQKAAIRKLAGHFTPGGRSRKSDVKQNFLTVWQILLPLYNSFRERLLAKGMAYEGMVYRSLADRLKAESVSDMLSEAFPARAGFVFVGLNALNECEKAVMSKMRNAGLAEFCWDFPGGMVSDPANPSSHFMQDNIVRFGNALSLDPDGISKPAVHVISVPSATGQAKLLPSIVEGVPEDERTLDFAVVLPDETMLTPVLDSIPESVAAVNVTMGYPLASSAFYSFMRDALAMQMHLRRKDGEWYFYHKQVYSLFSAGTLKSILNDEEKALVAAVRKGAKYYIPEADFSGSPLLELVFSPVVKDMSATDAGQIRALASWQLELVRALVERSSPDEPLMTECAFRYFTAVSILKDKGLAILPRTWARLVAQSVAALSVPFEGEPLGGMQVMGPLETRALDFKRVVILSASEGVFPRRSVSSSFIPPELRKAFGLPTYEYQNAVWAYYFYRLISRAEDVWMIYDSRPDANSGGEESRYIKQLRYLYPRQCALDEAVAGAEVNTTAEDLDIPKTASDIERIRSGGFSASTLQTYISCPAKFYFSFVKRLRADQEVKETLDRGLLGEVCHDTLWALYCGEGQMEKQISFDKRGKEDRWENVPHLRVITREYLEGWLARVDLIRRKVMWVAADKLHTIEVTGRDLVSVDIAVKFVTKVLEDDIALIRQHGPFTILGLEKSYYDQQICGHKFVGFIDRLDSFEDGSVRVVDYKSGSDSQNVLAVGEDDAEAMATKLFDRSKGHEVKAALQFYIYDKFVGADPDFTGRRIYNSMYAMSNVFASDIAVHPMSEAFTLAVDERLATLFAELENPQVPFSRAPRGSKGCEYCDFKLLCGRATKEK